MSDVTKIVIDPDDVPQCMHIAADAMCSLKSVRKYARGEKVRELLALRIEKAARERAKR